MKKMDGKKNAQIVLDSSKMVAFNELLDHFHGLRRDLYWACSKKRREQNGLEIRKRPQKSARTPMLGDLRSLAKVWCQIFSMSSQPGLVNASLYETNRPSTSPSGSDLAASSDGLQKKENHKDPSSFSQ